ncbi:hypothetical protein O3M35_002860 [Rhynocoris fuscipes]|uniref:Small ribosomal subunit protein uS7 domain-containing protein n=1 Tax=Rhynocoris fuscipes TaxID=488301 RepID=A0AAW1CSY9_9HEMI
MVLTGLFTKTIPFLIFKDSRVFIDITRNVSYGANFIDPIFRREELEKLKNSGEAKKLAHVPIKAAKSEQSCSEFYDPVLEKFINYVMRGGRKELARSLVSKTLETIKRIQIEKYNKEINPEIKNNMELNALNIFHKAIENCKPVLGLTPIKRGGSTYQVPIPISDSKATFLAMNWLIEQGKAEPKDTRFYLKLANEMINASNNEGKVVKRKQDLHKQCEANRAYAHYRWG